MVVTQIKGKAIEGQNRMDTFDFFYFSGSPSLMDGYSSLRRTSKRYPSPTTASLSSLHYPSSSASFQRPSSAHSHYLTSSSPTPSSSTGSPSPLSPTGQHSYPITSASRLTSAGLTGPSSSSINSNARLRKVRLQYISSGLDIGVIHS